jgi:hypothetical protein
VYVGLPGDPSGEAEPEMPVPKNLNYDMWLASTPNVYYTKNECTRKIAMIGQAGSVVNSLVRV